MMGGGAYPPALPPSTTKPPLFEDSKAQAGSRSPAEHARNLQTAGIEIEEPRHPNPNAECELRSGSEPGVRRNRFQYLDTGT